MPYSIEWYVPRRVILEKAFGDVTVEELLRFNAEVTDIIAEQGVAPVHVILDLTQVGKYPSLPDILRTMRRIVPGKAGWILVVTQNPVLNFVVSILFQIARLHLRIFTTMPEAVVYLGEIDDTLARN